MTLEEAKKEAQRISATLIIPCFLYEIDDDKGSRRIGLTACEGYLYSETFKEQNGVALAEYYDGHEC